MTATRQIGWGVLGAGGMARRFAGDLRLVAGARLVAVAARSAAKAQAAAKAIGAAQGVEGRDALLALPDVEVVYIATPNHRHRDDCLAALTAGKHVLCEKPLAMNAAEAREIAAAAQAAGRFCMEALWTHFIPAVSEAETQLNRGAIGTPRTLLASFGLPTREADDAALMPDGGALLDRGCYLVSLALRLFGEPTAVDGRLVTGPGGADLSATATLSFAGGRTALLAASVSEQLENRLFVAGSAGSLRLDDPTCPTALTITKAAPLLPAGQAPALDSRLRAAVRRAIRQSPALTRLKRLAADRARLVPCRGMGFVHEIEEVHACLAEGRLQSAIHPLSRSIRTLQVIDALVEGSRP
jgi:predicted dehydrogenase